MRILIACTHQNIVGGVETYLSDLIPSLRQRGHALALFTSTAPAPPARPVHEPAPDIPVWSVPETGRAEALRKVETWKPDVVFLHGLNSAEDEQALVERGPAVLFAHGHSGTCISGSRTHAFPTYRPCTMRFGPSCLLHYLPRGCGGLNPLTMARLYATQRRRFRLLPRYAAVIVTSRYMVEEYARHGVPEERIHRIPLFPTGMTPDPCGPAIRPTCDRVLMVGRLYKEKGGRVLVEAVARLNAMLGKPVVLAVAGDGPERPAMEALAAHLNVPTEFHGWVGPERRTALMRGADLLAVPSVCPETFGLVGVEAGCVGLPAVAFAVGGIPDWLVPGKSGDLAPGDPPTAGGLAQALMRVLGDSATYQRLSAGAWEMARSYTREGHVSRVEEILKRATIGSSGGAARSHATWQT